MYHKSLFLFLLSLFFSINTTAALYDRGNGFVYDDILDITWSSDANLAKTLNFDFDGRMTWDEANNFAENLVYQGKSDWRLPKAAPEGESPTWGFYSLSSELGHMYYVNLGHNSTPINNNTSFIDPDSGLSSSFSNLNSHFYWLGDEEDSSSAWRFRTDNGGQTYGPKANEWYAWLVHDGDIGNNEVASVPIPNTLLLFGSSLFGFILSRWRQ